MAGKIYKEHLWISFVVALLIVSSYKICVASTSDCKMKNVAIVIDSTENMNGNLFNMIAHDYASSFFDSLENYTEFRSNVSCAVLLDNTTCDVAQYGRDESLHFTANNASENLQERFSKLEFNNVTQSYFCNSLITAA